MSDKVISIIPQNPFEKINPAALKSAVKTLKSKSEADEISFFSQQVPQFVDCGQNFTSIKCPCCAMTIDFGWWGDAMSAASDLNFESLQIITPCCHHKTTLNDLIYDYPCGFACCGIALLKPIISNKRSLIELLQTAQFALNTPLKIIHCRR